MVETPKRSNQDRNRLFLLKRPEIVTAATVIINVDIGSDYRMVMSNMKLDVGMERKADRRRSKPKSN